MSTTAEVQAILDGLAFKKRHTTECQTKNGLKDWEPLSDSRKRCTCAYWSCGVHVRGDGFKRMSTGEVSLERAKAVAKLRIETGNRAAVLPDQGKPVAGAIEDFMQHSKDGGLRESSLRKYQTLMDQLQAFCDWKGLPFVQDLNQDAVMEFRRAWEDPDAGYKRGRERTPGVVRWRAQSVQTCRRNLKTMRLFFKRCIERKWLAEDPSRIIRFPKESGRKTREDVKYLTPEQLAKILDCCDGFYEMPEYNRERLKTLILLMRWSGLRISDAVVLRSDSIKDGVLYVVTKKASTPVQIPLHQDLAAALGRMTPYADGYLFWNKREKHSKAQTVQVNFGKRLKEVFDAAGVTCSQHHVSHMLRNTFAVDLLEKGLPLESVSLLLGHKSVQTTERFYADFSKGAMDNLEDRVRKIWQS